MAELDEMTKAELLDEARELGLEGVSTYNKADLLYVIKKEHSKLKRAATLAQKKADEAKAAKAAARAEAKAQAKADAEAAAAAEAEAKAQRSARRAAKKAAESQEAPTPEPVAAEDNGVTTTRYQETAPPTRYNR